MGNNLGACTFICKGIRIRSSRFLLWRLCDLSETGSVLRPLVLECRCLISSYGTAGFSCPANRVGMGAGLLPPLRGKAEIAMLAGYGAVAGYFFGFMLNLSFWPFSLDPSSSIAYLPGLSFAAQWHRYLLFDATTSLGWDTGRAVTDVVLIAATGPAVLSVLRRAARKASFRPPVRFQPADQPSGNSGLSPRGR
jgi:hypothetical protein